MHSSMAYCVMAFCPHFSAYAPPQAPPISSCIYRVLLIAQGRCSTLTDGMHPHLCAHTSTQASNKITYKITLIAEERCTALIGDFNACAKGRNFSMLWACKAKYNASQDCVHQL